jgi:hypothetical protein
MKSEVFDQGFLLQWLGYTVNLSWKTNVLLPNRKKYRTRLPGDESKYTSNKTACITKLIVMQLFYKSSLLKLSSIEVQGYS